MVLTGTFQGYRGWSHVNSLLPKKDYLCQGFLPVGEGVNGQCCVQIQWFVLKVFYCCQQNLLPGLDGQNQCHSHGCHCHGELETQWNVWHHHRPCSFVTHMWISLTPFQMDPLSELLVLNGLGQQKKLDLNFPRAHLDVSSLNQVDPSGFCQNKLYLRHFLHFPDCQTLVHENFAVK